MIFIKLNATSHPNNINLKSGQYLLVAESMMTWPPCRNATLLLTYMCINYYTTAIFIWYCSMTNYQTNLWTTRCMLQSRQLQWIKFYGLMGVESQDVFTVKRKIIWIYMPIWVGVSRMVLGRKDVRCTSLSDGGTLKVCWPLVLDSLAVK